MIPKGVAMRHGTESKIRIITTIATLLFVLSVAFLITNTTDARQGCCSWHGGVCGCGCCDGTPLSDTCAPYYPWCYQEEEPTTPPQIYGCTNPLAINYDYKATKDNGSCILRVYGCTDKIASNYNASANTDDSSCQYINEVSVEEAIKFDTKYEYDSNMSSGKETAKQDGVNGSKLVKYKVTLNKDGKELKREKLSEAVKTPAKEMIIVKGTRDDTLYWIVGIGGLIIVSYALLKSSFGKSLINRFKK